MEYTEKYSKKRYRAEKLKLQITIILRSIEKKLDWLPICKNYVCYVTATHHYYSDNMYYVIQALKKHDIGDMNLFWVTKYPKYAENAVVDNVKVIKYKSIKHFIIQFFSKIIISDDYLYHGLIIRKKQIYINVWHGGINYKGVGEKGIYFSDDIQRKRYKLANPEPDYMVAGCEAFIKYIQKAFGYWNTTFIRCGLPRNDIFFSDYNQTNKKVKKKMGCDGKKILCYMPTFRKDKMSIISNLFNYKDVLQALNENTGQEWMFVFRSHYYDHGVYSDYFKNVIDATEYENVSELLCATDILISDYSSCMWDFGLTQKLCISYVPDSKQFVENDRGLTEQGFDMPFPKASNTKELIDVILNLDIDGYKEKIIEHKMKVESYETGNASELVSRLILSKLRMEK